MFQNNRDKFILCGTLSVALGLTAFLIVVITKLYRSRRRSLPPLTSPPAHFEFESEFCDHEVDTQFRNPLPEPIFVSNSAEPRYGTIGRVKPVKSILRNSSSGDSPARDTVVRYSTIGRPKVTQPATSPARTTTQQFPSPTQPHTHDDMADPRSLTLSRAVNSDHPFYG